MAINALISYSYADEKILDRLHKNPSLPRREGDLQAWSDHDLLPGPSLGAEISAA
jgi:hypothetical protein